MTPYLVSLLSKLSGLSFFATVMLGIASFCFGFGPFPERRHLALPLAIAAAIALFLYVVLPSRSVLNGYL